jgi:hypothetical protein
VTLYLILTVAVIFLRGYYKSPEEEEGAWPGRLVCPHWLDYYIF